MAGRIWVMDATSFHPATLQERNLIDAVCWIYAQMGNDWIFNSHSTEFLMFDSTVNWTQSSTLSKNLQRILKESPENLELFNPNQTRITITAAIITIIIVTWWAFVFKFRTREAKIQIKSDEINKKKKWGSVASVQPLFSSSPHLIFFKLKCKFSKFYFSSVGQPPPPPPPPPLLIQST